MMGIKTGLALICALAVGCVTEPSDVPQSVERAALLASAAKCDQSICAKVCESGKNMKTVLTAYLACFSYLACACGPIPSPNPPDPSIGGQTATGGTTSTGGASFGGVTGVGGSSSVDGFALCVAATKASADRQRQASDNGMSISTLATALCEPLQVRQCYASGVCQ